VDGWRAKAGRRQEWTREDWEAYFAWCEERAAEGFARYPELRDVSVARQQQKTS